MLDILPANNWRYTNKMDIKPSGCIRKISFGDSDDESNTQNNNSQSLREMQKEIQKTDQLRWNFDFTRDKPLSGSYQWKLVTPCRDTRTDVSNDSSGENSDRSSESESDSSPTLGSCSSPQIQKSIPDFFQQKKRSTPSTKGDESRAKRARISNASPHGDRPLTPKSLFNPIKKPDSQD